MRRAHEAPLVAHGTADVRGAQSALGALIARTMTFPRPGNDVPVHLRVTETATGTRWERRFGAECVRTVQRIVDGHMVEHRDVGRLWFQVSVADGEVRYETVRAVLCGLRLPKPLMPRATGLVVPTEDGWRVRIEVSAPFVGLLCAYDARLRWVE
jgi:hypothetical protein